MRDVAAVKILYGIANGRPAYVFCPSHPAYLYRECQRCEQVEQGSAFWEAA